MGPTGCGFQPFVYAPPFTYAARELKHIKTMKVGGGELKITSGDNGSAQILLARKAVYSSPAGTYLSFIRVFRCPGRNVVLIESSLHGNDVPVDYFFLIVRDNGKVSTSEQFSDGQRGIQSLEQQGEKIIVTFGMAAGQHEVLVLDNHAKLQASTQRAAASVRDAACRGLYGDYKELCIWSDTSCQPNEYPMGLRRTFGAFPDDELHFDEVCTATCKAKQQLPYEQFARRVCSSPP